MHRNSVGRQDEGRTMAFQEERNRYEGTVFQERWAWHGWNVGWVIYEVGKSCDKRLAFLDKMCRLYLLCRVKHKRVLSILKDTTLNLCFLGSRQLKAGTLPLKHRLLCKITDV